MIGTGATLIIVLILVVTMSALVVLSVFFAWLHRRLLAKHMAEMREIYGLDETDGP